jgi:nitrite reductase/ring-hydroxylating ferredoxin subunit
VRRRRKDVDGFVDALLDDKRPPRFPAEDDEARQMLLAATLRAGRPGADAPRAEFVDKLERALRRQVEAQGGTATASPLVTRRRLLGGAAAAAAAVAAGAGIDRVIDRRVEPGAPASSELVPSDGRWVDVAAVEEVPVGRPLRFSAGAIEGFVVNHGDRLAAVSALCTHLPCTLQPGASGQRLDCPCHGAWFGLDGKPMDSAYYPAQLPPLPAIRTRVVDGRVHVFTA